MQTDPWSRPTAEDVRRVLESIEKRDFVDHREVHRLELSVPAEVITPRGNTIDAMTREISREGIGLLHRGAVPCDVVTVKVASDTRVYQYRVQIEWCTPCENGMFISGGRFLSREDDAGET